MPLKAFTDLELNEVRRAVRCHDKCHTCEFCPSHGVHKRLKLNDGTEVLIYKPDASSCGSKAALSSTLTSKIDQDPIKNVEIEEKLSKACKPEEKPCKDLQVG